MIRPRVSMIVGCERPHCVGIGPADRGSVQRLEQSPASNANPADRASGADRNDHVDPTARGVRLMKV